MNVAILCNGDFPTAPQPLKAFGEADQIVCCDGAYDTFVGKGLGICAPIIVIGDMDSIGNSGAVRCIRVAEQDTNDQTKAFRYVRDKWPEANITILGATGKREDHTLGNISLLADYFESVCNSGLQDFHHASAPVVCMLTDYGRFTPVNRRSEFASFARQQVSLFSMTPGCLITTEGLKYPLCREPLPRLWQGTLNACLGDSFAIIPENGIVIVYQTYQPKEE